MKQRDEKGRFISKTEQILNETKRELESFRTEYAKIYSHWEEEYKKNTRLLQMKIYFDAICNSAKKAIFLYFMVSFIGYTIFGSASSVITCLVLCAITICLLILIYSGIVIYHYYGSEE